MKIDILTVSGSPMHVTEDTIYGDGVQLGVGGAELALLTMCRAWATHGHEVTLYNNPRSPTKSIFSQRHQDEFNPREHRDVLIYFRGPNKLGDKAVGKKVWWSCDQYTVGSYPQLAQKMDKVVTISPFHAEYFKTAYDILNTVTIDLPVREWDYPEVSPEKSPLQVLYCSIPDRGVEPLSQVWDLVTKQVPEAQLHITSDWRLWDAKISPNTVVRYRMMFAKFSNVHYHSLVSRKELVDLQMKSSIHLYPVTYEELFCISVAECQYAGAYPITANTGAVATTNMGYVSPYSPRTREGVEDLAKVAVTGLTHPEILKAAGEDVRYLARKRFSIDTIVQQWEEKVFGDL